MIRTACTEPQCLYKGALYLYLYLYLYSPYGPYGLYRASVPVQGCTLPLPLPLPLLCIFYYFLQWPTNAHLTDKLLHSYILLYVFFWVIPRRLNFICRRFGTSAYKIQTPWNYPEEITQHSEHGESLKTPLHLRNEPTWCTKSCFIVSLLNASTCFEHYALIIRRSKVYYTASGIDTVWRWPSGAQVEID